MKRRFLSTILGTGIVVAVTVTATTAAFAHHRPDHNPPGQSKKYGAPPKLRGGGPPPWAPAWGHRRKTFTYWRNGVAYQGDTDSLVRLPDIGLGGCNRDIMGAVLGGAVGAAAGSQVGKGDGRTPATIGGAIIGALVGGNIGRAMDQVDQNCVGQVLERTPEGRTIVWNNPDRNGEYRVTPTRTYQDRSGDYCREYQTKIVIDGRVESAHGTACRQADGTWKRL